MQAFLLAHFSCIESYVGYFSVCGLSAMAGRVLIGAKAPTNTLLLPKGRANLAFCL